MADDSSVLRARTPSMAEVAARAGVSAQTVSRVLSGHRSVTEDTRNRVLAAADHLGYRMNKAARTLVTGRSHTLGVVVLSNVNFSSSAVTLGIENAARREGYATTIATCDPRVPDELADAMARLDHQSVDGIIVASPLPSPADALEAVARRVPTVTVDGVLNEALTVTVDQNLIGTLATQHLLNLGHPTVHHVTGPGDWIDASGRVDGWRATLLEAGATIPDIVPGDWSPESGYEAGKLLAQDPTVSAVFVANDEMAAGVLRALSEAGRRVPQDVSVIGVDDISLAAYLTPALTTIAQPFVGIGEAAVAQLLKLIDDPKHRDVPPRVLMPALTVRASTGPYSGTP